MSAADKAARIQQLQREIQQLRQEERADHFWNVLTSYAAASVLVPGICATSME
ncbi:hypothetical protein AK812_SmicGene47344, partial [Symbiodinium microadriaticum]